MDLARVGARLKEFNAPGYRLDQVRRAVFDDAASSYDEISALPADLRGRLAQDNPVLSFSCASVSVSHDSRARKAVLKLHDGGLIETVLLRPSDTRWTTCISSQVGCAIGCTFCATGLMGLSRDLTAEEITDQVLFWRQFMAREKLEGRLSNVVYMGMGEPFAAYESVAASLKILLDQKQFGLGARHISVSTSGLAPQMERFARDFPQINLALSLHAANDALRTKLVPLNKAFPLSRIAQALKYGLELTGRKVFLEYVLLRGENDAAANADELIAYVKSIGYPQLLHVNLIVFNQTETPHQATSEENARIFQKKLHDAGVLATVRQNLGQDIQGACGQLVTQSQKVKP